MKAVVDVAIPLFTFLLLTAVGLDLTTGDFRAVRREPRIVAIGLFAPVLVLPIVALALIRAFGVLALLVVVVVSTELEAFLRGLTRMVPLSAAFVAFSFATGWLAATAGRASRQARFTLAVEFATRNIAVATAIAVTVLHRSDFAVFAATYFLTECPLMLGAVGLFRAARPLDFA